LRQDSQKFEWTPETETQKFYQQFILTFVKNPKLRPGPKTINSALRNATSSMDLQYCAKILHLYATRFYEFNQNTSSLLVQKYSEFSEEPIVKLCFFFFF
jgi:hypothetical protein